MHKCPDCQATCNCPTGNESPEFCTHCAESLLTSEEEGNYVDMSQPLPTILEDDNLDEENFV